MRHTLAAAACALALVLSGCLSATADPTPTAEPTSVPATSTPAGPPATPTPDPAVLLRDGGIAIIESAYGRLLDEYIDPVEPAVLLDAAWVVMSVEARALGREPPPAPSFAGDRAVAFGAFRAAYVPFANSVGDPTKLRFGAIRGMAQVLQDCHTFFLNPVASDTLEDARAGRGVVGIGVELAGVPPLVTEVITGGPAARAGVLVGDRVVAVDGTDTSGSGPASAFDLINGAEGTSVRVELTRGNERLDLSLERARVTPPNVEGRVLPGGIGYVRVRNFVDGGVREQLVRELARFEGQGATGWIIDIRGNPGGRLDTDSISLFIKEGVVVRDRGRNVPLEEERATGDVFPSLRPTVLLINNRTGSVAEAFAAALDEYDAAYLIGANTNGCAGFTDVRELGDGSSLAVTTHVNLGPVSGAELNGIGVAPDLAVARTQDDIASGRDPQLDAAVAFLTQ